MAPVSGGYPIEGLVQDFHALIGHGLTPTFVFHEEELEHVLADLKAQRWATRQ